MAKNWSPWQTLLKQDGKATEDYAVIVLNRPITFECENHVVNIWNNAKVRITVDGGTDRWLKYIKTHNIDKTSLRPTDLITGDMDSISTPILKHYSTHPKTRVIVTEDQNKTDFTKALIETKKFCLQNDINLKQVFVLTESSGRLDQILSNINTLYIAGNILPETEVFLFCAESLTWLLDQGEHCIEIPRNIREAKECCGLIPLGGACKVTTTGLKWNLNNSVMEFGHLVSTSNTYNGDSVVSVRTDQKLVWTMSIEELFNNETTLIDSQGC